MQITGSFHWNKKEDSISYIIINKKTYEVLETSSLIKLNSKNFKKNSKDKIKKFFDTIKKYKNDEIFIEYKTFIPQFKHHHPCSNFIEEQFNNNLNIFDKKHKHKIKSLPKGNNHKNFKAAINEIIYNGKVQKSYIIRLWEIALHVTPKKCEKIIQKLYA